MLTPTASSRQGPTREGRSEGSRRQTCEPRDTNAIEGRHPRGESAQHDKALWSGGHGKWRGCAGKVHVLIRGDLLGTRPPATGAGLRPRPKGREHPPDPIAALAAQAGAIRFVIEQKSAEVIVVSPRGGEGPNLVARWSRLDLRIGVDARQGQPDAGGEARSQPWAFNGSGARTQPLRLRWSEHHLVSTGCHGTLASP